MPYRNKTFVSFDGDNDMPYYRLMCAWKQNDNIPFNFYNAHDLNYARDSSHEESIKVQLRIRMQNSKEFILLIGEKTRYLYKFVRWEIEQALARELPIIAVNLNGCFTTGHLYVEGSLGNLRFLLLPRTPSVDFYLQPTRRPLRTLVACHRGEAPEKERGVRVG